MEAPAGGSRDSAAEDRGEEPSGGGLTCAPERYRAAKFSLAAYLLCWALLRWYQDNAGVGRLAPHEELVFFPHNYPMLGEVDCL
ncbi:hypothetical protein F2P81_019483 [Scophthalmus maximus]|uniref:Uncharacterized protein n=1 Tax=Scophthalmus maximus TaxID=52904 RepID=A0A6A4RZP6_SCOMX|nr:hypothetical protein F2P81_019483 [Scophthalmus maximus]